MYLDSYFSTLQAYTKKEEPTCVIEIGDTVLVRQKKVNKFSTYFEPTPYEVVLVKGSMISARRMHDGRVVTRNSSFYKRFEDDFVDP